MSPEAATNMRRLGILAVIAAGFLAWRTYQQPVVRDEAPPPSEVQAESPAASPVPPSSTPTPDRLATVLDRDANGDDRRKALYELTEAGPAGLQPLRAILLTPVPEDPIMNAFEVSLRITALEAIDDLAERGVDVGDAFEKAAQLHDDRALKTLAVAGMSGIQEGRPGKAKRFIKKMTDESED